MSMRTNALPSLVTRFARTGSGIAAVEFALIVPIMLLLYLGAVDLTQGLMADRKLTHLAGTLGDLVAQDNLDEITGDDIEGYFAASAALMRPYDGNATPMRISIVAVDDSGDADVTESVAVNGMTPLETGTQITLPEDIANLASGRCAVIAEGWYAYSPMFSYVFQSDVPLYQRSIHIPRMDTEGCEADGLPDLDPVDDVVTGVCAGFSGNAHQGANCENNNNSWGTGNGQGGGITNSGGPNNGGDNSGSGAEETGSGGETSTTDTGSADTSNVGNGGWWDWWSGWAGWSWGGWGWG
ncbi:TadE/TadG family type IV pilus assembly protein [Pelagibacterium halotolerans]|uniref:TadE/TadG family type IV pilus assembly protein n=1 Tax=Pelagibacterium halotolerans TaxID=531813 RepID=UPI00384E3873